MNLDLALKHFNEGVGLFGKANHYGAIQAFLNCVGEGVEARTEFSRLLCFNALVNAAAALTMKAIQYLEEAAVSCPAAYRAILSGEDPECQVGKVVLPLSLRTKLRIPLQPGKEKEPEREVSMSAEQAEKLSEESELVKKVEEQETAPSPEKPAEEEPDLSFGMDAKQFSEAQAKEQAAKEAKKRTGLFPASSSGQEQ